jgi:predicted dehydrogenase
VAPRLLQDRFRLIEIERISTVPFCVVCWRGRKPGQDRRASKPEQDRIRNALSVDGALQRLTDLLASRRVHGRFPGARWYGPADEVLTDTSIVAVAIEGRNHESLAMAEAAVGADKHVWYDKPAGDDWARFAALMVNAQEQGLLVQMGYMFRYQPGFQQITAWA